MDDLAKQMKAMIEKATLRCERATEAELIAWADTDTILAMFAQKELVWRDRDRTFDAALARFEE